MSSRPTAIERVIEEVLLLSVGAVGVALGIRTFAPAPVVAAPPPVIIEPPGGFPAMREHADEVNAYALRARLDPTAHTIEGSGSITLRNVSRAPLSELRLHLYLNAFEGPRTLFRRERVEGGRGQQSGAPGSIEVARFALDGEDLWPGAIFVDHRGRGPADPLRGPTPPGVANEDRTDVRLPLPAPIPPGESRTFEIAFTSKLPEVSERTGFHGSFHFAGQWFPKLAKLEPDGTWAGFPFHHNAEFYADYGRYDVTIDVPERFLVGATGPRVSSSIEGGRRIERHVQGDVHDFAWTAWDRFVERRAKIEGVDVHVLSPPGHDAAIDRELATIEHGLRDKGARFGRYPYEVLTVVHPPSGAEEAGGMEYPTLITTGGPWWPNHGGHEIEAVTLHELGHQWFYGLVATHEVAWPAGDEGFNSFGDEVGLETLFGGGGSAVSLGPLRISTSVFSRRGAAPPFDEPIFQPAHDFAHGRAYGARVYGGTATVLVTLRRVYGEARFDTAMGIWARRHRFGHPTAADFFALLDETLGADAGAVARAALERPSGYDVYVERIVSERSKLGPGHANAVWIGRRGLLDFPVDVELRFAGGARERRVVRFGVAGETSKETWARVDADGPSPLVAAIVDPDWKLPIDRNRLDDFASTPAGRGGAPVTRERAVAWIQTLVRGLGP
jgi:hypothetical protein